MKNIINRDFEKLILDGCKVINKQSINYDKEYTHILVECPKDYRKDEDQMRGAIKFISINFSTDCTYPSWYEATLYYSTKRHANSHFLENVKEDRRYNRMRKENETN